MIDTSRHRFEAEQEREIERDKRSGQQTEVGAMYLFFLRGEHQIVY
jgi:hypothetical protein